MASFGMSGGLMDGREVNRNDPFEMAVVDALGQDIKGDDALCKELWGSLANVAWASSSGVEVGYSFRAAGDLIAAIRGSGNYLDWYCCAPAGVVGPRVKAAMEAKGWFAAPLEGFV